MAADATNALAIIRRGYRILNVIQLNGSVPAAMATEGLTELNGMISGWAQQSVTIPAIAREVFDLVANKGGPSNPYTIGIGANLNTARPPNQNSLVGASLILTSPSPTVEVRLDVLSDQIYNAIPIKELTSAQPTGLYYNPTFATTGFGRIQLYPVPDNATNDLALYLQKQISEFADLETTTYQFPPGYVDALTYQLVLRLATLSGRSVPADAKQIVIDSFEIIQRSNGSKLVDLGVDPMWLSARGWPNSVGYNIQSGNM